MSLRGVVIAAVVLAIGALAWQKQDQLRAWVGAQPPLVMPDLVSSEAAPARKCVKGQQVSYTNVECPAGTQAQAVKAMPVNVVPATPVPRVAQPGSAPSALREALDIKREDPLRAKALERAIDGIR